MWLEELIGNSGTESEVRCYFEYRGEYFPIGDDYEFPELLEDAMQLTGLHNDLPAYKLAGDPFLSKEMFLEQLSQYFQALPAEDRKPDEGDIEYRQRVLSGKMNLGDVTIALFDEKWRSDQYWIAMKRQIRKEQEWLNELWAKEEYNRRERDGIPHPPAQKVEMKILDLTADLPKVDMNGVAGQSIVLDCYFGVKIVATEGEAACVQLVLLNNGNVVQEGQPQWVQSGKIMAVQDIIVKKQFTASSGMEA
jgi:hypothetical protein